MQLPQSIMIVDDDPDDIELFCQAVGILGNSIQCIGKTDPIDALNLISSGSILLPQYIFLDMNMPRMNGREFLEAMQQNPRLDAIEVIIYSTAKKEYLTKQGMMKKGSAYVQKPGDVTELAEQLKKVFGQGETN